MKKTVKSISSHLLLDPSAQLQSSKEEVKFDLYLKLREIKEISRYLEKILLTKEEKRMLWVNENEDLIHQLLDSFITDSTLILDGMTLDGEAMSMSVDLMSHLRQLFNVLQSLLKNKQLLN